MEVNGRVYPMWGQFVEKKEQWIGGILQDFEGGLATTIITDIKLRPNGKDSAYFEVLGEDWGCGGDVQCLGITAGEKGYITFSGYGGHTWRIKTKQP